MSTTAIGERRQTSLPTGVSEAAGLKPDHRVEWRFEDGDIRGHSFASGSGFA